MQLIDVRASTAHTIVSRACSGRVLSDPVAVEVVRRRVEARAATCPTGRSVEFEVEFVVRVKVGKLSVDELVSTWGEVAACVHVCGEHGQLLCIASICHIINCEVVRSWSGLRACKSRIVSNVSTVNDVEVLVLPVILDVVTSRNGWCGCLESALGRSRSACTDARSCHAGVGTIVQCVVESWCVCRCGVNSGHVSEGRKECTSAFNKGCDSRVWNESGDWCIRVCTTRVGDLDVRVRRTTVQCVTVQIGVSCHSLSDTDGTSVGLCGRDVSCSGT